MENEQEYEAVYQVYHAARNGFGGNQSLCVAVTEETDDRIHGREFSPTMNRPGTRVTVIKDNVAGWRERHSSLVD